MIASPDASRSCGRIFYAFKIAWALRQRPRSARAPPVFFASAFFAPPYAHVPLFRADLHHLPQGIFPVLLGVLVWIAVQSAGLRWLLGALFLGASLLVTVQTHPGWQCRSGEHCVDVDVAGDMLRVDRSTTGNLELLEPLEGLHAPRGEALFATPLWPGTYAVLAGKTPPWDVYSLFPWAEDFQKDEIPRIEAAQPRFAVVCDFPLDVRQQTRLKNSRPLTNRYIEEHFDRLDGSSDNASIQVHIARNGR